MGTPSIPRTHGLDGPPHRSLERIAPYRHRRHASAGFLSADRDLIGALPLSSGARGGARDHD